jgi:hypothetical protein
MATPAVAAGMVLPSPPQATAGLQQGWRVSEGKGNKEGNDGSNKGGRRATATRAIVVATTLVDKDAGNGDGNEGGGRQWGWGWYGNGKGDMDGGRAMVMATKRAVAMATRVMGKDEGNGKVIRVIAMATRGQWQAMTTNDNGINVNDNDHNGI